MTLIMTLPSAGTRVTVSAGTRTPKVHLDDTGNRL